MLARYCVIPRSGGILGRRARYFPMRYLCAFFSKVIRSLDTATYRSRGEINASRKCESRSVLCVNRQSVLCRTRVLQKKNMHIEAKEGTQRDPLFDNVMSAVYSYQFYNLISRAIRGHN